MLDLQVCAYKILIYTCIYVYVYIYVDVKIVVRVKNTIEITNIVSQGHSLLNFQKWLQALTLFFPCMQQFASLSLFLKSLGKTKY